MKKISNLPLKGSIALLLNDADMHKLGFGVAHIDGHVMALCDVCAISIWHGSYIYVPSVNGIICQKCFEDWQKNGAWYEKDNDYQNKRALYVANKLGYKSLNGVSTIEYENVDTDSNDKYANLSNEELKAIYDDMIADDEISRQKEL